MREREKTDKSAGDAVNVTRQVNLGDIARLQLPAARFGFVKAMGSCKALSEQE